MQHNNPLRWLLNSLPAAQGSFIYDSFGFPYTSSSFIFLGNDTSSAAVQIRLTAVASAINLDPTWSDTLTNLTYTIYHHSTPYFTPNAGTILAEKSVLGHTDGNIVNNESNYFYLVHEAHCNPNSSQQIGIFKFPIIAAD